MSEFDAGLDLDERFRRFMDSRSWAESIDVLPMTSQQGSAQKADYLIQDREVVVEVKSVQKDMTDDFRRALEPFTREQDWPVFYGKANVAPFLERHPRRSEIMPVLLKATTRALDDQITKANKQIRETKRTFELPHAAGLVVYLNDRSEVVAPNVIAHRVDSMFRSRHADGRTRFSSIHAVLIVSATHFVNMAGVPPSLPCILIRREGIADDHVVKRASDSLVKEWAHHNGSVLFNTTIGELDELSRAQSLVSTMMRPLPLGPKRRYQIWIDEYHQQPFLRPLDDDALIRLGADLIGRLGAGFLKHTKYKPSDTERLTQLRVFQGLLEELKMRGIGVDQIPRRYREYTTKLMSDLSGVNPPTRGTT